jgi:hypothetical protein
MSNSAQAASLQPLARSLEPLQEESLGGYLLRLSCRLRISPIELARLTGCADEGRHARISRSLMLDLDARRFAPVARLSEAEAGSLALASWADRYPPVARSLARRDAPRGTHDGWLFSMGQRYCPDCLAGDGTPVQQAYGGPWKKHWHLPVAFACPRHRRFLREGCPQSHPGGANPWRLIAFPSACAEHPAECRLSLQPGKTGRHRPYCGTRLDQPADDDPHRPSADVLAAQERLLALLGPQHSVASAASMFTDLRVLVALVCLSWPLARDLMDHGPGAAADEHVRFLSRGHGQRLDEQPRSVLAAAGLLTAALTMLDSPGIADTVARHLLARRPGRLGPSSWTRVLSRHQAECSPALRDAVRGMPAAADDVRRA